jgi:DNA-binding PadR family transcriptional regulator
LCRSCEFVGALGSKRNIAQSIIQPKLFLSLERSEGSFRQIAELQGANRHADQAQDFHPESFEHAADLPVFAFIENNLQPGIFLSCAKNTGALGLQRVASRVCNAVLQSFEKSSIGHGSDLRVIGLVQMGSRIGDARGPFRIIGEKKKSFAGFIEPSGGRNPGKIGGQQRINGVASFFVGSGGHDAARLVEHKVDLLSAGHRLACHLDAVLTEAHWRLRIFCHRTVEADFSFANEPESLRTGAEAELGKRAGKAHMFGVWLDAREAFCCFHGIEKQCNANSGKGAEGSDVGRGFQGARQFGKFRLTHISVIDISVIDTRKAARKTAMKPTRISDELQQLLPLTPAVFYVLFSLAEGEKHGYAIMLEMSALSNGEFRMGPGTLYTTLQRLLDLRLIAEVEPPGPAAQRQSRRRYYRLNADGRLVLAAELSRLDSVVRLARRKKLVPRVAE